MLVLWVYPLARHRRAHVFFFLRGFLSGSFAFIFLVTLTTTRARKTPELAAACILVSWITNVSIVQTKRKATNVHARLPRHADFDEILCGWVIA